MNWVIQRRTMNSWKTLAKGASLIVIAIGIAVIVGWAWEISLFKSLLPGMVTMKSSTAIGLILSGITLWLCQTQDNNPKITYLILLLSSLIALLGCLAFIQEGLNLPLSGDQLVFRIFPNQSDPATQGGMAPNTALNFLFVSAAFILYQYRRYYLAQLLTAFGLFVAFLALIGHIYHITLFYGLDSLTGMAIHTAVAFILLTIGMLFACPQRGWVRHITTNKAGGIMARRLLPLAIILPPLLGWLIFSAYQTQPVPFSPALFTVVNVVSFSGIIYWNAIRLNFLDRQRLQGIKNLQNSEQRFRGIFNQTYQFTGLLDLNGIIIELNETALNFMGVSLNEVIAKPFWEVLWKAPGNELTQEQQQLTEAIAQAAEGNFVRYDMQLRDSDNKIVTLDFSLKPILNDQGDVVLLIPEGRDISEQQAALRKRKEAEMMLRHFNNVLEERIQERTTRLFATQTLYESIFEHSAEAIFLLKVLSEDEFVFEAINPTTEQALGISAVEITGKTLNSVFSPEIAQRLKPHFSRCVAIGHNYTYEETLPLITGTKTWRTVVVPLRDEAGTIVTLLGSGRDITEERQALRALQESENRLQNAIDHAPLPIALHAEDGEILQINQTWTEISGYTHAEIPTIPDWTAKAYGERQALVQSEIESLYSLNHPTEEGEFAIATKTGETRIWDFSSSPIGYLADGRRLVISMAKDVTDRKELERSLRQSQAQIQKLVNSNIIGIKVADLEGRILQANEALLQLIGYSPQELEAGHIRWDTITPCEYSQRDQEALQQLQETGSYQPYEKEYLRKDGTRIPILIGGTWLEEQEGLRVGFVLDIRERKQVELALQTRLQQQATIAQLGQLALSDIELDSLFQEATELVAQSLGVEYCKVLQLLDDTQSLLLRAGVGWETGLVGHATVSADRDSQAGYTLLSQKPVIVQDLPTETRFSGPPLLHQHGIISGMSVIIANGEVPFGVLGAHTKAKREFTQDDANFLQSVANILSAAIQRKQSEAKVTLINATLEQRVEERTSQLEEINQQLEAFSYSISHDLRAPLRAIQGFATALLDDYGDSLDDLGLEYAERLVIAAERLDQLIQDLLSYSRLSRVDLQLRPISLASVVAEVQNQLEGEFQERQARVTVIEPLPEILGVRSVLLQVIANLLTNALKFMPPETPPSIRIWSEDKGETVRLWIEDNGIGIAPQHHSRIFNLFERLHGIDNYPGTGIGLAIVAKGMQRLGGRVGVESVVNNGSRFWIEGKKP